MQLRFAHPKALLTLFVTAGIASLLEDGTLDESSPDQKTLILKRETNALEFGGAATAHPTPK